MTTPPGNFYLVISLGGKWLLEAAHLFQGESLEILGEGKGGMNSTKILIRMEG